MASLKAADGVGSLSDDNHEDAPGQAEFDELLHSNVLDMLGDFDFSCTDLGGTELEARAAMVASTSPKTSARKRSFPQTCAWENMAPKALTELSAGLLAGVWDKNTSLPASTALLAGGLSATATTTSSSSSAHRSDALDDATRYVGDATKGSVCNAALLAEFSDPATAQVKVCGEEHAKADATRGGGGGGAKKGYQRKRGGEGGGAGKRLLNAERMERKATREKRRREEVNQKFEQLLQVLEEAEATSGLEPPAAAEGQAGNACINGRRVEVLSRTITVVKKLLRDRRGSSSSSCCASSSSPPLPRDPALRDLDSSCLDAGGDGSSPVSDCSLVASDAPATMVTAAPAEAVAETAAVPPPPQAASVAVADSAGTPTMHMAMPLHGAHPSMVVPPGFAGMPAVAMSAAATAAAAGMHHHHHGAPGQPIFIAVPVYMPGQGMGSGGVAASAESAAAASHVSMPPAPPALAEAATSCSPAVVAPGGGGGGPVKLGAGVGKEAWALPPGMGLQSMMTLQMPQFVTQALSAEEGDEKPTHAVCA